MTLPIVSADNSSPEGPPTATDLRELIRRVSWLAALENNDVEMLLRHSHVQTLKAHEWIFHQNGRADWLYIVLSGAVRLVHGVGEKRLATIRCVEHGGTLGELSMASHTGFYLYSAEALRNTRVLAIPAEQCRQQLDAYPACRAEFMSRMALELSERLEDLVLVTQSDAMARLVSYLLRQLPPGRHQRPKTLPLTIPRYWLAAQLSMTPETLSRLLAKLRDRGIIQADRRHLAIIDEERLRHCLMEGDT
ncbi:Crp/Fnr family transcriptional regulator [Vreelandella rituensis]|uniref:Crp/Fnr family transcriptional regulator n=1 Tax=Vreelandella rituensis TaxID=2282306 RepID=A0A368TMC9_9GAMM|nr:Crp/Fnr family transcriptional regulator [Halomonas rituensis]